MKDIRICSVETNGPIKELGNITGPIRKCRLELPKLLSMINNGHVIYELNPENLSERVRLTLTNANPSPFAKKDSVNKIDNPKTYSGGIVGYADNTVSDGSVSNFVTEKSESEYVINTAEQLASVAELTSDIAKDETTEAIREIKEDTQPNIQKPQYNNYSKHDKKNKHKHNNNQNYNKQNNVNNNSNVSNTTVEEKVVKSDF